MLDDLNSYAAHRGRKSATAPGANETDYEDDDGADGVVVVVSDHRLTSLKGNGSALIPIGPCNSRDNPLTDKENWGIYRAGRKSGCVNPAF